MSNYRRLISYIYAYEGGIKGKNVGFAKLEVRNGQCKIQVNVRNVYIGSQDTGVYLLSGSEEILVGRIFIRNGAGEFRAVVAVGNVAGSGHTIDQCYGLTVHNLSDSWQCYTTIWEDAVAHAAEVALEEATSERVKKEEPVKGSVAKAVEAEIEAQSRQEEETQQREMQKKEPGQPDLQDKEEVPSSIIPPDEPEDKEVPGSGDMGVMEIRPMEVLPIGKELTAEGLRGERGEEGPETAKEVRESQAAVQGDPKAVEEGFNSVKEKPEFVKEESESPEEPLQGEINDVQENAKEVKTEPEFAQSQPKAAGQKPVRPISEENNGLGDKSPQRETPAMPEPAQQPTQQPTPQAGMQENIPTQPFRQNQWGQPGMLFPPNWFTRSSRQGRSMQQTGQPMSSRQNQDGRTGQSGGPMQPGYGKSPASGQVQPDGRRSEANMRMHTNQWRNEPGTAPESGPQSGFQGAEAARQPQPGFQGAESGGQPQPGFQGVEPAGQPQPGFQGGEPARQPQPGFQGDEPAGQPQPGFQGAEPDGQPQPGFQGDEPVGQPQMEYVQNQPGREIQAKTLQAAESAVASEPVSERPQAKEPILQSVQQPSPGQRNAQQTNRPIYPAGILMPEQNMTEDEPKIDSVWQRFYKTYPKIQAFDYNGGCEIITIKPQDIGLLPRETWGYGNNSFLLHGYYNHRYLIFARLNNPKGKPRFLLGVPGHYYSNEKYMAAMFGFPNFVLSKVQPAGEDRFGYWYTDIRLGS